MKFLTAGLAQCRISGNSIKSAGVQTCLGSCHFHISEMDYMFYWFKLKSNMICSNECFKVGKYGDTDWSYRFQISYWFFPEVSLNAIQ